MRVPQLGTLARELAGDDIGPFVAQTLAHHPSVAAELGDGLAEHVGQIRDLAFRHGLRRASDIHRFVDLGLVMGMPWLEAQHDRIAQRLQDPGIADLSRRLDALFEDVLTTMDAEAREAGG